MDCPKCGEEIPDRSTTCPRCGDGVAPTPEQQAENLKERLKAKIKECHRTHKLGDALNFIDIYMSTIGIDKEIYQIRNMILQEKRKRSLGEEGKSGDREGSAFEELFNDANESGSEQHPVLETETEEAKKEWPMEEKPEAVPIRADDDIFSSSGYDLVLGTNEEIYQSEKEKDEPVVEIAEESPFKVTDYHDFEPLQKETPAQAEPKVEEEVPILFPQLETEIEPPEEKRYRPVRRRQKWVVFGTLGTVAVLAVAAALYFFDPFGLRKKGDEPVAPQVIVPSPIRPKPRIGAQPKPGGTLKPKSGGTAAGPSLQDAQFNRYLELAKEQYQKGNLSQAQSSLIQAKRIKSSDDLNKLELKILKKLGEMENSLSIDELNEKNMQLKDDRRFEQIQTAQTISAFEEYLRLFPAGRHTQEARKKISELEKKNRQVFEADMAQKAQDLQQAKLRPLYKNLALADIEAEAARLDKFTSRIEEMTIDEEKVVIDFATGLMWHQWDKPMFYDKAQWWAARRYSGYFDWRLPTTEEALSLIRIEQKHFPYTWSTDYEIWTGDLDIRNARSAWAINLNSRSIASVDFFKLRYVFSVRTIKR